MTAATSAYPSAGNVSSSLHLFGGYLRNLAGWRQYLAAFTAGAVSALAFAPFDLAFLLLLAFAVLVLLLDGANRSAHRVRVCALVGWCFGFGQFLAGLYWVAYAFTVVPAQHAWQIPFVETLLPGGLALFPAMACAVAGLFWRPAAARVLILAMSYAAAEWLRGHVLTGFPWNLPAYAWGGVLPVLQSAAVVGAYGLSALTILFGVSLACLFDASRQWRIPVAMTALFVVMAAAGVLRLAISPTLNVAGVELRLVQPNVRQQDKYVPEYRVRNWRELIALSREPARVRPTHIIWPEAAPPFLLSRVPQALDEIAALTQEGRVLMTGAVRAQATPDNGFRFFNSFFVFGRTGELLATYDKFHLVPFGEYLPLAGLLTKLGISKLVDSPGGFSSGEGPHTYAVPGAPPVGPLICYEVLFPSAVTSGARPGWLVNVTDDSWFGPSTGPEQHLLSARVRAIEEGIPIARAANTGISAVIDPMGRVVASLGLGKTGIVDSALPAALPTTLYARLGDTGLALILIVCGIALTFCMRYYRG